MKTVCCGIIMLMIWGAGVFFNLCAADDTDRENVDVDSLNWIAFGPAPQPAMTVGTPHLSALLPGTALQSIPDELTIDDRKFPGRPVTMDPAGKMDFGALFDGSERGETVYLMTSIQTESAGILRIGAGADWWMHWWINGNPVFDTLTTGNRFAEVAPDNHTFDVPLNAGGNILAVAVIAGSRSFLFSADVIEFVVGDDDDDAAGNTTTASLEYVAAMAAGRRKTSGSWADKALNDFPGASLDFLAAAATANPGSEKAEALLAWGNAKLADPDTDDYHNIRAALGRLLPLRETSYRHRSQIYCLIAETYLMEKEYEAAHRAVEHAIEIARRQRWKMPAKLIQARTYVLQRNYQEARLLLNSMAAMDAWRSMAEAVDTWLTALPVVENMDRLGDARPRLFLNRALLEDIRRKGLTPFQHEWLDALKTQVNEYPQPPERDVEWIERMKGAEGVGPVLWAGYASHAALAWLLTEDREYYECAVAFLEHASAIWQVRYDNKLVAYRFHHYRINGLAAFDWLYNDLPVEQRNAIGRSLFASLREFHRFWADRQRGAGDLYNDGVMGWFIGLVFMGNDIPEIPQSACLDLLASGYYRYRNLFEMLEDSGPDALFLYGAPGYVLQNLAAEANFLDSYRLALCENYARGFPKRARNVANYTLWNTIAPNRDAVHLGRSKPFTRGQVSFNYGWGDEYHINNRMGRQHYPYLMRVADLYAGMDDMIELDELIAVAQTQVRPDYETFLTPFYCWLSPSSPLLMSSNVLTDEEIRTVMARLPRARHFPDPIGHTFMNSGWGEDDTYAMFVAGRRTQQRKHYDENHFIIYKKGFLAMDTGSRFGTPGHPGNYYHQTIAHNCILIHMEGERTPSLWGRTSDVNTRGMNKNHGAQVLAFETDEHCTYIASDTTGCYHEDKSEEVVRQFLFVYPDYFVVFDRVASKKPDQKKTWLLHTQLEPVTENDTFHADHGNGRIFARTLLPRNLQMEKIGGPGREFWVDGQNWPVREDMQRRMYDEDGNPTPEHHLFGQWRVEISNDAEQERALFLHLLQVGDREELVEMTPSHLIEEEDRVGVEFMAGPENVRVMFNVAGKVGGHIRVMEKDKIVLDRPLATDVMPQEGLGMGNDSIEGYKKDIEMQKDKSQNQSLNCSSSSLPDKILALKQDALVTIRSSLSSNQDVVINVGVGHNYNQQINFGRTLLLPHGEGLAPENLKEGIFIHACGDDATPWNINGTYIGGNHGCYTGRLITSPDHGLTAADIGSEWRDGAGTAFYVVKIIDADKFWILSENKGTNAVWKFKTNVAGPVITNKAHGKTLNIEDSAMTQLWPACRIIRQDYLVDGKTPMEDGIPVNCSFLEIIEEYDIINTGALLDDIIRHPGVEADFTAERIPAVIRNHIVYRFYPYGAVTVEHRCKALQEFEVGCMGFVQSYRLNQGDFATHEYYVPKTVPFTLDGISYDFNAIQDYTVKPTEPWRFGTEYGNVKNPDNLPDRFMQFLGDIADGRPVRKIGYAMGYSLTQGLTIPARRARNCHQALSLKHTTRKTYPSAIDSKMGDLIPAGTEFHCFAYRQYFDASAFPGATAVYWHPEGSNMMVYAHFHQALDGEIIKLPSELAGKPLTVIEKTDTLAIHPTDHVPAQGLTFSVQGESGYIVFKVPIEP